ncbi:MAG: FeoB-associated Cys-rich membrane protein [Lachnospiraceae bacterium]|nr:FeoB-associated Cys-rich membrane protein [Lachnospiraceae bacterium]
MADVIGMIVIVCLVGAAIWYIRKEKKKGVHCIGCPSAGTCARRMNGGCAGMKQE